MIAVRASIQPSRAVWQSSLRQCARYAPTELEQVQRVTVWLSAHLMIGYPLFATTTSGGITLLRKHGDTAISLNSG